MSLILTKAELLSAYALKNAVTNPPIHVFPRGNGLYTIEIDACDTQVGCILLQAQKSGAEKRFGYWSGRLSASERQPATTHKESVALLWAILLFRLYLERRWSTVRTDREDLKRLIKMSYASEKLARW